MEALLSLLTAVGTGMQRKAQSCQALALLSSRYSKQQHLGLKSPASPEYQRTVFVLAAVANRFTSAARCHPSKHSLFKAVL